MRFATLTLILLLVALLCQVAFAEDPADDVVVLRGADVGGPDPVETPPLEVAPEEPAPPPNAKGIRIPIDSPSKFLRVGDLSLWYGQPEDAYIRSTWMSSDDDRRPRLVKRSSMGQSTDPSAIKVNWMGRSTRLAEIKSHWMGQSSRRAGIRYHRMGESRSHRIRHHRMGQRD